jgi:hypothetical protein
MGFSQCQETLPQSARDEISSEQYSQLNQRVFITNHNAGSEIIRIVAQYTSSLEGDLGVMSKEINQAVWSAHGPYSKAAYIPPSLYFKKMGEYFSHSYSRYDAERPEGWGKPKTSWWGRRIPLKKTTLIPLSTSKYRVLLHHISSEKPATPTGENLYLEIKIDSMGGKDMKTGNFIVHPLRLDSADQKIGLGTLVLYPK